MLIKIGVSSECIQYNNVTILYENILLSWSVCHPGVYNIELLFSSRELFIHSVTLVPKLNT